MLELEVKLRDANESAEILRDQGVVPAIFYGPKENSTPVSIDSLKLERIWREAGETTIVRLKGVGEEKETLFHDVQIHPVTGKLLHADFYCLERGKKIILSVPLKFVNVAPAEKAGHIIVKTLYEVEIEVSPQELPHNLPVDLSLLRDVGDHIMASQIPLPESASLITEPDEIVASVKIFEEEPEEVAPLPETEIIGEKKEGTDTEAPAAYDEKKKEE